MQLIVLDDDESTALFMATVARKLGWTAQTVTDESNFQALDQRRTAGRDLAGSRNSAPATESNNCVSCAA